MIGANPDNYYLPQRKLFDSEALADYLRGVHDPATVPLDLTRLGGHSIRGPKGSAPGGPHEEQDRPAGPGGLLRGRRGAGAQRRHGDPGGGGRAQRLRLLSPLETSHMRRCQSMFGQLPCLPTAWVITSARTSKDAHLHRIDARPYGRHGLEPDRLLCRERRDIQTYSMYLYDRAKMADGTISTVCTLDIYRQIANLRSRFESEKSIRVPAGWEPA
jgi:hypothetical protein